MKRLFFLIFSICLAVSFCGCNNKASSIQEDISIPTEVTISSVDVSAVGEIPARPETEEASAYAKDTAAEDAMTESQAVLESILKGTGTFYDVEFDKEATISDACAVWSAHSGITVSTPKFSAVDMDGDGVKEIIFKVLINGVSDYGVKVIHCENGNVYGFTFSERQLGNIKDDGSFWCSGSEDYDGAAKLTFNADAYSYTAIPMEEFDSKLDITWYEYPGSNYSDILRDCIKTGNEK